jgi:hypothetical protein
MAAKNAGHKLFGVWTKLYEQAHGDTYIGSRYRDAGMLKRVADDIGESTLLEIMEYYFERRSIHDFTYFIFNYHDLHKDMQARQRDRERIERIRKLTAQRLQERDIEL